MFPTHTTRQLLASAVGAKRFLSVSKGFSWRKSSPVHVTAILVGCVSFEFFYGAITDNIWEGLNKGVSLLVHIDTDSNFLHGRNSSSTTRWTSLN
jgi:hypothetical protein